MSGYIIPLSVCDQKYLLWLTMPKGTRNEGTVAIVTVKYEILTGGYWLCVRVQGVAINVSPWL